MKTAIRLTVSTLLLIAVATVAGLNVSIGTPVAATDPVPAVAPQPSPSLAASNPDPAFAPRPLLPFPDDQLPTPPPALPVAPTPCQTYPCDGAGNSNGPFAPGAGAAPAPAPAAPAVDSILLQCNGGGPVNMGYYLGGWCGAVHGGNLMPGASIELRVKASCIDPSACGGSGQSKSYAFSGTSGSDGKFYFDAGWLPWPGGQSGQTTHVSFAGTTATWNGMTASL